LNLTPSAVGSVPCSDRHLSELVSLGTIRDGAGITSEDIERSCRDLAARVIGRSDPTAAGDLAIGTLVSSDAARSPTLAQTLHVTCYIEPLTRPLSGTVVGLRDRPLPYAK